MPVLLFVLLPYLTITLEGLPLMLLPYLHIKLKGLRYYAMLQVIWLINRLQKEGSTTLCTFPSRLDH